MLSGLIGDLIGVLKNSPPLEPPGVLFSLPWCYEEISGNEKKQQCEPSLQSCAASLGR